VYELVLERSDANLSALDAELRAALGDVYTGLSRAKGRLRVHFRRPPRPDEEERARYSVTAHDPSVLTNEQLARRALLDRLKHLEAAVHALDLSEPLPPAALEQAVRWLLLRESVRSG